MAYHATRRRGLLSVVATLILLCAACSGAPTSPTTPPLAVNPVLALPAVLPPTPVPNPLLSDPRFDLGFYRQFALNALDSPNALASLRRLTAPPTIHLRSVDVAGAQIDAATLDSTKAAFISTVGQFTGTFGIGGIVMVDNNDGGPSSPNHIYVFWNTSTGSAQCGFTSINQIQFNYKKPNCGCNGLAIAPTVVRHELGHAMGFYHTDSPLDVMNNGGQTNCNLEPSARERFHGMLAYGQTNGSRDPQ